MKLIHNGKTLLMKQEHVISEKAVLEKIYCSILLIKPALLNVCFVHSSWTASIPFLFLIFCLIFERLFSLLESVPL